LEEVLSLSGARQQESCLSDHVRAELKAALAPLTKEGGNEKLAIRILARSLRLDQVLQIIGATGWLIEEVLDEIFYTIRRAMQFYDEDSAPVEKSWAGKLLSDLSKQCTLSLSKRSTNVSDNRCQLAWVRRGREMEYKIQQCRLIGMLFSPAMLVNMFEKAVDTIDEDLMGTLSAALITFNENSSASIATLLPEECNDLAKLILKVDQHSLQRPCRIELISMAGSIMTQVAADLKGQLAKQVNSYAKHYMHDRYESCFDHAIVWTLEQFVQNSQDADEVDEICSTCSSYVKKYDGYTYSASAKEVVQLANNILNSAS
jgi:hypothetical protein